MPRVLYFTYVLYTNHDQPDDSTRYRVMEFAFVCNKTTQTKLIFSSYFYYQILTYRILMYKIFPFTTEILIYHRF